MFKIEFNGKMYVVSQNGVEIESFDSLFDALDYRACLLWERDNAFNDIV
jgi:hypothetical protein